MVVRNPSIKFQLLFTFLRKNMKKKIMVFFSSCMSVKFHYEVIQTFFFHYSIICSFSTTSTSLFSQFTESRSSRSELPPTSSSVMQKQASCSVPTLLLEVWISLPSIGLSSTILQMIPKNTSIGEYKFSISLTKNYL